MKIAITKRPLSTVAAIGAWGLLAFIMVPACTITIGARKNDSVQDDASSADNNSQDGRSDTNDIATDQPSQSEEDIGEQVYTQLDPHELALAQAKAGHLSCALAGTLDSLNLDPSTLDDATLMSLIEQYGPAAAELADTWFSENIDSSMVSAVNGPKFECKRTHGCEYWTKCSLNYIPNVAHSCYVDDCGTAKCSTCPDFVNTLLQNIAIKAWCSYVCTEDGTRTPNIVAVGAGGISPLGNHFIGTFCLPYP
ncbi:hypothetical protein [Sorangium sp. So ce124]|uniref:hypothetical protein n=1 Tax=Sorangium sp. So ce124 TaxID=3133280 RepID=UPI003F6269A2